jgi:hypothetical protein
LVHGAVRRCGVSADYFIGHQAQDMRLELVSRTPGASLVVGVALPVDGDTAR